MPLSVGLLLPVLISADLTATIVYRRHADWKFIARLLPFFIVGTVLGWLVFDYFQGGDERVRQLKYVIAGILLSMTALHFLVKVTKKGKVESDAIVTVGLSSHVAPPSVGCVWLRRYY